MPHQPGYRVYLAREMAVTFMVLYGKWPMVQQVLKETNKRAQALGTGGFNAQCLRKIGLLGQLGPEQARVMQEWMALPVAESEDFTPTGAIQLRSERGVPLQSTAAAAKQALTSQHDAQPETAAELRTPSDQGSMVQLKLMVQLELRTKPQARDGLQHLRYPVPPAHGAELKAQTSQQLVQHAEPQAPGARGMQRLMHAQRGTNREYNCYHSHWCTTQPPTQPQDNRPQRSASWRSSCRAWDRECSCWHTDLRRTHPARTCCVTVQIRKHVARSCWNLRAAEPFSARQAVTQLSARLLEPAAAEPFSARQAVTQLSTSLRAPTGEPSAPGRSSRHAAQHPTQPQGLQLQVWVQQGIQRQHGIGRQGAERLTPMQCNVQMAPPKTLQAAAHHLLVQQLQSVAADQHNVERSEPHEARSLAGPRAHGTEPLAQPREHGVMPPAQPLAQLQVYGTGPWRRPLPRHQKHVAEPLAQRLAQPQEHGSETRAQPLPQGSASPAESQRGDEALELTATGHVCALPAAVQRGNESAVSGATARSAVCSRQQPCEAASCA
ncbi:hypothetical protein CYMTET_38902 [Cymbomonas tetramitiformis]|uniref:Uncharacterized protein n=1 Tax=Cymbomonas tetramitiformis TaxID=36881 RepID=A0AAE0F4G7_9CHLO|nr:hypothetical protein CYMTET_38902 [Cymbomonas tetramitiformis]